MKAGCRFGLVASMYLAVTATVERSFAADFLRGDANNDGVVTLADAHRIVKHLFFGGLLAQCEDAADADDDGEVLASDFDRIVRHLGLGNPIPPPFPDFGVDPTPQDSLPCETYGTETVEDPAARIEIVRAVAEGGESATATITIAVSTSLNLAGYSGAIDVAGSPITVFLPDNDELTGWHYPTILHPQLRNDGVSYVRAVENRIEFGYLTGPANPTWIEPADGVRVMEFPVCLWSGTVAGDYELELSTGELVDFETATSIPATLVGGTLTVAADVVPVSACGSNDAARESFRRGDVDGDRAVSLTDAVVLLNALFLAGTPFDCPDAGDSNDDGTLNLTDALGVLNYLFLNAAAPAAPGPSACGADQTEDMLANCETACR